MYIITTVLPYGRQDSGEKEVELCVAYARTIMEEFGHISALVIGISSDSRHICNLSCNSTEQKHEKASIIKANFRELGVTAIVWISEAWVKVAKREDVAKLILPVRDMPDKEEAVIVSYNDGVTAKTVKLPIIREYGKVFLGKPEEFTVTLDNLWGDFFNT